MKIAIFRRSGLFTVAALCMVSAAAVPAMALAQQAKPAASGADAATDPARLAQARGLVAMLDLDRTLDSMFVNLKPLFAENVVGNMSRSSEGAEFFNKIRGGRDRFSQVLGDAFLEGLRTRYPDFKEAAAQEYARLFTTAELEQLSAFFRSGVGEKWRASAPVLEQSMGKWGQQIGSQVGMEAMMAVMKRFEDEQKSGTGK